MVYNNLYILNIRIITQVYLKYDYHVIKEPKINPFTNRIKKNKKITRFSSKNNAVLEVY